LTAAAPTPTASGLDPETAIFRPGFEKIRANLEMLLGTTLSLEGAPSERLPAEALRGRLPEGGVLLVGRVQGGNGGETLFALERPAALALAAFLMMTPEAAIRSRLEELDRTDLLDAERESLGEIGNFAVAGFSEPVRERLGARVSLAAAPARFLSGPAAVSLEEAVVERTYVCAEARLKAGAFGPWTLTLCIPAELADEIAPPPGDEPRADGDADAAAGAAAAESGDPAAARAVAALRSARASMSGASGGEGLLDADVALVGDAEFRDRLRDLVPQGTAIGEGGSPAALAAALEAGASPKLVVADVPGGAEHRLDLLAALRRHPASRGASFLVVVGRPTRQTILKCGALGLADALPPDAPADVVARRLETLFAAATRARR